MQCFSLDCAIQMVSWILLNLPVVMKKSLLIGKNTNRKSVRWINGRQPRWEILERFKKTSVGRKMTKLSKSFICLSHFFSHFDDYNGSLDEDFFYSDSFP